MAVKVPGLWNNHYPIFSLDDLRRRSWVVYCFWISRRLFQPILVQVTFWIWFFGEFQHCFLIKPSNVNCLPLQLRTSGLQTNKFDVFCTENAAVTGRPFHTQRHQRKHFLWSQYATKRIQSRSLYPLCFAPVSC